MKILALKTMDSKPCVPIIKILGARMSEKPPIIKILPWAQFHDFRTIFFLQQILIIGGSGRLKRPPIIKILNLNYRTPKSPPIIKILPCVQVGDFWIICVLNILYLSSNKKASDN